MIRAKRERKSKPIIDLTGPEGNAFVLLGKASSYARQLDLDPKPILEDMKSGDYEHLIEVFEKHFGKFVILER